MLPMFAMLFNKWGTAWGTNFRAGPRERGRRRSRSLRDGVAPACDQRLNIFDGIGGAVSAPLTARLGPGGRYLPHGTASGTWGDIDAAGLAARRITTIPLTAIASEPRELYDLVEEALRRASDGTLRPTVGQTFPLERAADAHVAMEARLALGKTLLVP